jgi:hypothetical protein
VVNWFELVFSFLDDRHFVIPSVLAERSSEALLNVYRLCPRPQPGQQQQVSPSPPPAIICSYVLPVSVLEDIRTLRFFPDVSAQDGASPGHFYADASRRMFGIQIEATFRSTSETSSRNCSSPFRP